MPGLSRKHFDVIDSTQDYALAHAIEDLKEPDQWYLYTASEQTQGRGTGNRTWVSTRTNDIYATYALLVPRARREEIWGYFYQVAALSVVQALRDFELNPSLKWPNDVLLEEPGKGKAKVCGVLPEYRVIEGSDQQLVVIGIGVNVNKPKEVCDSIDQPTTSVALSYGRAFDEKSILERVSHHLMENVAHLLTRGFGVFKLLLDSCFERYNDADIYFSKVANVHEIKKEDVLIGKIVGTDAEGRLLFQPKLRDDSYDAPIVFNKGRILRGREIANIMGEEAVNPFAAAARIAASPAAKAASPAPAPAP